MLGVRARHLRNSCASFRMLARYQNRRREQTISSSCSWPSTMRPKQRPSRSSPCCAHTQRCSAFECTSSTTHTTVMTFAKGCCVHWAATGACKRRQLCAMHGRTNGMRRARADDSEWKWSLRVHTGCRCRRRNGRAPVLIMIENDSDCSLIFL